MYASAIQILLSHEVLPKGVERGERRCILVRDQPYHAMTRPSKETPL
jgi:hypothetical protein